MKNNLSLSKSNFWFIEVNLKYKVQSTYTIDSGSLQPIKMIVPVGIFTTEETTTSGVITASGPIRTVYVFIYFG